MKETYDVRIRPEHGHLVFGPDYVPPEDSKAGFRGSSAKGVVGDELYRRIEEADRVLAETSERGTLFFGRMEIKRSYTATEIDQAQLFLLRMKYSGGDAGAGEEHGTWYTDGVLNEACAFERQIAVAYTHSPFKTIFADNWDLRCALSSRQVGPLRFPFKKMRKAADIFGLWGGEVVVSERLAHLIESGDFTGGKVQPIWNTSGQPKCMPRLSDVPSGIEFLGLARERGLGPTDKAFWSWLEEDNQLPLLDKALWEQMRLPRSRSANTPPTGSYDQLIVHSSPLVTSAKTVFGENSFRPGSGRHCSCAFGELWGHTPQSSLSVVASSWDGSDICRSDVYVGGKGGLFRPWRLLVISKRLFDAMRLAGIKGFDFELVELV
jgi:hypothetical protein